VGGRHEHEDQASAPNSIPTCAKIEHPMASPRRLRMTRPRRLQAARNWIPTYTGRDIVRGYRRWYGVDTVCAILELRMLGINVPDQRLQGARLTESEAARQNAERRRGAESALLENPYMHNEESVLWLIHQELDEYPDVAPAEEIAENDFNLNIPRYVDTFEEEEEIDVAAVERDIERLEGELAEVRMRMKAYLKELGL
jgi:type I restriction-modification system DNA methylase subunit